MTAMAYKDVRREGARVVGEDDYGRTVELTPTKETMGGRVDEFKDPHNDTYETNHRGTGHKKDDNDSN